jgi:hypothetical protein
MEALKRKKQQKKNTQKINLSVTFFSNLLVTLNRFSNFVIGCQNRATGESLEEKKIILSVSLNIGALYFFLPCIIDKSRTLFQQTAVQT